jgi:hypothetical protein
MKTSSQVQISSNKILSSGQCYLLHLICQRCQILEDATTSKLFSDPLNTLGWVLLNTTYHCCALNTISCGCGGQKARGPVKRIFFSSQSRGIQNWFNEPTFSALYQVNAV